MMKHKSQNSRILLSKNEGGAIAFCEACDVLELEIGTISLRVNAPSLEALSQLINEATESMKIYKSEKARFIQSMPSDISFH